MKHATPLAALSRRHTHVPHPLCDPAAERHGRPVVGLQWTALLNVHNMILVHGKHPGKGVRGRDQT